MCAINFHAILVNYFLKSYHLLNPYQSFLVAMTFVVVVAGKLQQRQPQVGVGHLGRGPLPQRRTGADARVEVQPERRRSVDRRGAGSGVKVISEGHRMPFSF